MRAAERPGGEIAAAFAMLTTIPVRSTSRDATGAAAYGLVGAVVGALGGVVMVVLGEAVPTLAAVLAVTVMAVASGAIHLDGLADTTDALLARDAAQAEIARKDPAIGSGGVVALILVLAAEVTALASLAVLPGGSGPRRRRRWRASRLAPPRGRSRSSSRCSAETRSAGSAWEHGSPNGSAPSMAWLRLLTAALVAVVTGLLAGAVAFGAGIVAGAALGLGAGLILVRARRQVDGDVLGATVELGFAADRRGGRDRDVGDVASPLILALGGTRSGKSRFGLAATRRLAAGGRAWFLATAWPGDPEMDDRIERHRRERPDDWPTIEVGSDLVAALAQTEPREPVLIDGLTLWLSAVMGDDPVGPDPVLDGPLADALEAIATRPGPVVIVSDEVGSGIVPMHAGARVYRDLVGIAHQRIAAQADEVDLLVAGLPIRLKGPAA